MYRIVVVALAASSVAIPASAEPLSLEAATYGVVQTQTASDRTEPGIADTPPAKPMRFAAAEQRNLGGGFIEFLFTGGGQSQTTPAYRQEQPAFEQAPMRQQASVQPAQQIERERPAMDPRFLRHEVDYAGSEKPGTIIINTPERYLYLVEENGKALRWGVGVGKPGFSWAGEHQVTAKREWPDWRPPADMLRRRPDLPHFMPGGPENPLGARAMYLGSTLYRIHGSNEPWTIGHAVSSGCIRMRNEDVKDLYERVKVGTKVVVI